MLEIAFPSTKLSKFPGETCPRSPLDTPAFAGRCLISLSLNPRSELGLVGPTSFTGPTLKKIVNGPWFSDILELENLEKS